MLDVNNWQDGANFDWRIGAISFVDQHIVKIKASATDILDQVVNGEIREIKSLNQYLFSYLSVSSKVIFKVVSIEEDEFFYGKDEDQKSNDQYLFKAVPLGEIEEGIYHPGIIEIPMVGSNVYACSSKDLQNLFNDGINKDDEPLGNLVSYQNIRPSLNIDRFYSNHNVIIGNTGSGKSTTSRLLLEKYNKQFCNKKIKENAKVIVFDVHGDYLNFLDSGEGVHVFRSDAYHLSAGHLNFEDWEAILAPSQRIQKPLLERAVKYARLNAVGRKKLFAAFAYSAISDSSFDTHSSRKNQVQKYYQHIQNDLDATKISEEVKRILKNEEIPLTPKGLIDHYILTYGNIPDGVVDALQEILCAYIGTQYMSGCVPDYDSLFKDRYLKNAEEVTLEDIRDALDFVFDEEEVKGNRQARSYSEGLVTQLNNLCDKYSNNLFNRNQGKEITDLIEEKNGILVIDVSDVKDSDGLKLFSNFVSRFVLNKNISYGKDELKNRPVTLFFDEAHRYIKETDLPDDSIFNRIAREGRKFGVCLTVISQIPSELSRVVLSQAGTFIIHRIQNSVDLDYVRRNVPSISSDQVARLSSFAPGMAVILGSSMRLPLELQIDGAYKDITSGVSIFS